MKNTEDKFITILTGNYLHELAVVRGRLETEGIECFVKDELTAQVVPFLNSIGGVQLQVKEKDLELAVQILKEAGYIDDNNSQSPNLLAVLDRVTAKIPFIGRLRIEPRLAVMMVIIIGLTTLIVYFAMLASV